MKAFNEVPREYYHYVYPEHRSQGGVAYEDDPKPWALGYGSALSDYLGQAYMTQVCKPAAGDTRKRTTEISDWDAKCASPPPATFLLPARSIERMG